MIRSVAISKNLLNEGETVVVDTRTHPKALLFPILMLVVFLAIGTFVQTTDRPEGGRPRSSGLVVASASSGSCCGRS